MELLRTGSAIALLCMLVNYLEDSGEVGLLHLQLKYREASSRDGFATRPTSRR